MSAPRNTPKDLEQLIQQIIDENIDDQNVSQLVEGLQSEPTAIDRFIDMMHLENSLRYLTGIAGSLQRRSLAGLREDSLEQGVEPLAKPWFLHKHSWLGYSLAVSLACLALGWYLGAMRGTTSRGPDTSYSQFEQGDGLEIAGQIVRFTPGTQWRVHDLAVMRGTYLRPGQHLEIVHGVAEIHFAGGGVSVVEGPVVLEVKDGRTVFVSQGNATVKTMGSDDLVLQTPSTLCSLRDAEVGVTVEDSGSAIVQSLSGTCEVKLVNGNGESIGRRVLANGVSARFDSGAGLISRIYLNRDTYRRNVQESFIAYRNLVGFEGNQNFEGTLGMDFVVKSPIVVTKLGVFDSDADGLKRPLNAKLWQRSEAGTAYRFDDDYGVQILAEMDFTPDSPGSLVESNRFKPLRKPLLLEPGAYTIMASGYGEGESNGNDGDFFYDFDTDVAQRVPAPGLRWWGEGLPVNAVKRLDDGFGSILFVGCARWDTHVGEFPRVVDGGAVDRYRAGTFEFELPRPSQWKERPSHSAPSDELLRILPDRDQKGGSTAGETM